MLLPFLRAPSRTKSSLSSSPRPSASSADKRCSPCPSVSLRGSKAVKPCSVSGNWRVTFRFEDGHAVEVDYTDYH